MNNAIATPLSFAPGVDSKHVLVDREGIVIALCPNASECEAILKIVNSHASLVNALKLAISKDQLVGEALDAARAALETL